MTPIQEEHLGKLMLHSAKKEGHKKGFPVMPLKPDELDQHKGKLAEIILAFLKENPLMTVAQIARGTHLNQDSVRSSLNRLRNTDAIHMEHVDEVMHFRLLCNDPLALGQGAKTRTKEERASVTA